MTDQADSLLRGSTAHAPDLNWSQVNETVLRLELAEAQIEAAIKIGSKYTTRDELAMFEAVMQGKSAEEPSNSYTATMKDQNSNSEFF